VLGMMQWRPMVKAMAKVLLILVVLIGGGGLLGWGDRSPMAVAMAAPRNPAKLAGKITETAPPQLIQDLQAEFEDNQPQIKILGPKPNEVLQDNTVSVQFQVKDLAIFKNEKFGLGPHLHVLLDNQNYQAVYDVKQPLVLSDLSPGTHILRAFASRPWHESFKNEGAYAQVTFHVFTKTNENRPEAEQPLLTYSRPQGTYGAEPILLDFYLTNAPLHLVAQEDAKDDIPDWRIRVTVNGDDFVLDRWEPIYLKGFKPGKNWVKLEYIDENGNPLNNVFSTTARLINWEPQGQDGLSRIVRGEVSLEEARAIADPTYTYTPPPPEPVATPSPDPQSSPNVAPAADPSPVVVPAPGLIPTPELKEVTGETSQEVAPVTASPSPQPVESPAVIAPKSKATQRPSLLRPKARPSGVKPEMLPEPQVTPNQPEREDIAAPVQAPQPTAKPKSASTPARVPTTNPLTNPLEEQSETPIASPDPTESPVPPKAKFKKPEFKKPEFFNRFQKTIPSEPVKPDLVKPDLVQEPVQPESITPPDPVEAPTDPQRTPVLSRFQKRFQSGPASARDAGMRATPTDTAGKIEPEKIEPKKVEATPIEKPTRPSQPSKLDGLMQRFRQKAAELQEKAAQFQEKVPRAKISPLKEFQRQRQPDLPPSDPPPDAGVAPGIPQSL
jgi:hypothetical protein